MVSMNMSLIDHTSEITIVMLHREWGAGCHHAECGAHTAVTVEGQGVGLGTRVQMELCICHELPLYVTLACFQGSPHSLPIYIAHSATVLQPLPPAHLLSTVIS